MLQKNHRRSGVSKRNREVRNHSKDNKSSGKSTAKEKSVKRKVDPLPKAPVPENMLLAKIDLCPFNYRDYYDQVDLEAFAKDLARNGVISPLTVRPIPGGRYQVVVGERRWRAAHIAELASVPVMIRELTDQKVEDMQLAENIHRENPHAMREARAIGRFLDRGQSVDQIANKMSKPKYYILGRKKLLDLIPEFQQMFLAGKTNLQESLQLALIDKIAQQEIYAVNCVNWETNKHFKLHGLTNILDRYKYDLNKAPFDTKDKTLLPEIGACTKCPFNTSMTNCLFPEMAKESKCTNKDCFQNKCNASATNRVKSLIEKHSPQALVFYGEPNAETKKILAAIPEAKDLPVFDYYQISRISAPTLPKQEDFSTDWDAENEVELEEPKPDLAGFQEAMEEYQEELKNYDTMMASDKLFRGILVTSVDHMAFIFSPERKKGNVTTETPSATSKQVQDAIKAGLATPELLQGEINRINTRESAKKLRDLEIVQENMQKAFTEKFNEASLTLTLTPSDIAAARLLLYQGLDYSTQHQVENYLFKDKEDDNPELMYQKLIDLGEADFCYLIRTALASRSDSKRPKSHDGYFLRQMAETSGMDVAALDAAQAKIAETRLSRVDERLAVLNKKLEKLNKAA
jgi:ParB/RepB/Spo0J family partition protein